MQAELGKRKEATTGGDIQQLVGITRDKLNKVTAAAKTRADPMDVDIASMAIRQSATTETDWLTGAAADDEEESDLMMSTRPTRTKTVRRHMHTEEETKGEDARPPPHRQRPVALQPPEDQVDEFEPSPTAQEAEQPARSYTRRQATKKAPSTSSRRQRTTTASDDEDEPPPRRTTSRKKTTTTASKRSKATPSAARKRKVSTKSTTRGSEQTKISSLFQNSQSQRKLPSFFGGPSQASQAVEEIEIDDSDGEF